MITGESIVKNYKTEDLEHLAEELNRVYNPDRLRLPMPIDPYDVADCLKLWLAFEFLSPDFTYQGAAVFDNCLINVWPSNEYRTGIMPEPKFFHANTIILNRGFCGDVDMSLKKRVILHLLMSAVICTCIHTFSNLSHITENTIKAVVIHMMIQSTYMSVEWISDTKTHCR